MRSARKTYEPIPEETNATSGMVVSAAIAVHTILGPGLLESTYLKCLAQELRKRVGLLINFNVVHLKDGIHRFVN